MRKKKAPGPEAERLKLYGNWKDLMGKALKKQKPITDRAETRVEKKQPKK